MAPVNRLDAARASAVALSPDEPQTGDENSFDLTDFEEEMRRLSAANQELLDEFHHQDAPVPTSENGDDLEHLRQENAVLKMRVEELEALASGKGEELWQERQTEYEMLLEEKSEVIRGLHQHIQEMQETVAIGETPQPNVAASGTGLGQAQEILRLKRELEDQRRQLEQDEQDMISQMRQMEMSMAKERAEMARQRQEVQRLRADLAREIEQSSRDPELRERLNTLRRHSDPRPTAPSDKPAEKLEQKSSGFFRRIFG